jgi:hypothetical protein
MVGRGVLAKPAIVMRRAFGAVLVCAWLVALPASAAAATLTVNNPNDEVTAADGSCSLREAIAAVDTPGVATDCGTADTSANTIVLGPTSYGLSIHPVSPDNDNTGDLNVAGTATLTITGSGASATTIDGSGAADRVLSIATGAIVTLQDLTITGGHAPDGATATIQGNNGTGGASGGGIDNAGTLTLDDVVVSDNTAGAGGGGAVGVAGSTGGNGASGGNGGGIDNEAGATLNVNGTTISGNQAGAGGTGGAGGAASQTPGSGGSGGAGGAGGGIYNAGTVHVIDSTLSGNSAGTGGQGGSGGNATLGSGGNGGAGGADGVGPADGGGIHNQGGTLTVAGSTFSSNTAGGGGTGGFGGFGAVGGVGGTGGSASWGGAISSLNGTVTVTNSTFSGNAAGTGGAGGDGGNGGTAVCGRIVCGGGGGGGGNGGTGGYGGAIRVTNGTSSLLNATVANSHAGSGGAAGLGGFAGSLGLDGSAGSAGAAGGLYVQASTGSQSMTLSNTIIASNSPDNCNPTTGFGFTDGGHNLSYPDTTCPNAVGADPKLGSLQDNGGPTQTLALGAGSPAIDAVPATGASCPTSDQRGVPRPQGAACDIGAYEVAPPFSCQNVATSTGAGEPVVVQLDCPNPAGAPVTYALDAGPSHGSLSAFDAASGKVTYTPAAGYVGGDSFTYHGTAANGTATVQTVSITVNPPPTCQARSAVTHTGAAVSVTLSCSDPSGAAVSYAIVAGPAHGTLSGLSTTSGQVTYTPAAGYSGTDTFTYHATSANGTASTQTVSITVNPPPSCQAQSVSTKANAAVPIRLGCVDATGAALTYALDSAPAHGTLGLLDAAAGTVLYTPRAGFTGADSFMFHATSANGSAAPAIVTITVGPLGRISSTMTWAFALHAGTFRILTLTVSRAPVGATIRVLCHGGGCSRSFTTRVRAGRRRSSTATVPLAGHLHGWRLRKATTLTVRIVRAGYIGKVYVFSMRHASSPLIGCLVPGSTVPSRC